MKNIIYIFVVLALLVASLLSLRGLKKEKTPETQNPTNTEVTEISTEQEENAPEESKTETASPSTLEVVYGSEGFSPSNLEIKVGDTVLFKNESGKGMWVASNPHPVHSDNPEFDAGLSTANGNSWSFTFTEEGTFSYHNHLNSSFGGKIIVKQ